MGKKKKQKKKAVWYKHKGVRHDKKKPHQHPGSWHQKGKPRTFIRGSYVVPAMKKKWRKRAEKASRQVGLGFFGMTPYVRIMSKRQAVKEANQIRKKVEKIAL